MTHPQDKGNEGLIAEIESIIKFLNLAHCFPRQIETLKRALSTLQEAQKDAERLKWVIDHCEKQIWQAIPEFINRAERHIVNAIDVALQHGDKPNE